MTRAGGWGATFLRRGTELLSLGDITCRDTDGKAANLCRKRGNGLIEAVADRQSVTFSGTDVQIGYDTKLNWFRTQSKHHQQVIHYFGEIRHPFDKEDKLHCFLFLFFFSWEPGGFQKHYWIAIHVLTMDVFLCRKWGKNRVPGQRVPETRAPTPVNSTCSLDAEWSGHSSSSCQ